MSLEIRDLDVSSHRSFAGHERVVLGEDPEVGYLGIVAVHSTALGPGVGGIRLWDYRDTDAALDDVLRLSRGMTYKCALAGLPLGGGKSVIAGDARRLDREAIYRAHARVIERLGGRYVGAEDVGTRMSDLEWVRQETAHVAGLADRAGDPSPATARGVLRAMEAAALTRWGTTGLRGRHVALQGCGNVGAHLARMLAGAGARLTIADVDEGRVDRLGREVGAERADPGRIHEVPADVFAPCALGGGLDERTIPQLGAPLIVGAANNQLAAPSDDQRLRSAGILYVPDYAANAGGVVHGSQDLADISPQAAAAGVERIYETVLRVLALSSELGIGTQAAADRMAEARLRDASRGAPPGATASARPGAPPPTD